MEKLKSILRQFLAYLKAWWYNVSSQPIEAKYGALLFHIGAIIAALLILLGLSGCSTVKYVPIESETIEKVVIRDSVIVRDSIVVIPIERMVDVVPKYDTLSLETSIAKSKSWVDTTTHTLKGEILNKEQKQNRDRTEIKYIHRTDSVFIEKPVPYPEPVPYVPKAYKWSMGFSIIVLLAVFGAIIWKLKRWFI